MITLSANAIPNILTSGMVVGTVSSTTLSGVITFAIDVQDPPGVFTIVGNKIVVAATMTLDAVAQALAALDITASDGVGSETGSLSLNVRDLADVPGTAVGELINFFPGNTYVQAGDGNDTIKIVGSANPDNTDVIDGGDGDDHISYTVISPAPDPFNPVPSTDNPDMIIGGAGNDYISVNGDSVNATVDAGSGADEVAMRIGTIDLGADTDADIVNVYAFSDVTIHNFNASSDRMRVEFLLEEINNQYGSYQGLAWDGASNPFAAAGPDAPNGFIGLVQDGNDTLVKVLRETSLPALPPEFNITYSYSYVTVARLTNVMALALTGNNFIPFVDPTGATFDQLTLNGVSADPEFLIGGLASDTINGGDGFDEIIGSFGNDTITGGAGYNILNGGAGNDVVTGGNDGNFIRGDEGNDTLNGGTGQDFIQGGTGSDTIHAGAGNDTIDDTFNLANDADRLYGDAGDDAINYVVDYNNQTLVDAADEIYGGDGNDNISAISNALTIDGGAGNDGINSINQGVTVLAGSGNDYVNAPNGNVTLGTGFDTVVIGYGGNLIVHDFNAAEDTLDLTFLLSALQTAYTQSPGWDGTSNPFAGGANAFVQFHQEQQDTLVQVKQEVLDNLGAASLQWVTVARLEGVIATSITNDHLNPPWNPNGSGDFPNYTPHANPDVAPFGGTDSIQFLAQTAESGFAMWRLGSDGSLAQISNANLQGIQNSADPIKVGDAMYFNLVTPGGDHQIFYNTSNGGRGGFSTHLNEVGGGIIVDSWVEFDGALYFHASAINPTAADQDFHAGIFKLDSATGQPVQITDETAGDPIGFFGPGPMNGHLIYGAADPNDPPTAAAFPFEIFAIEAGAIDAVKITNSNVIASNYPNAQTVDLGDSSYFVAVDKTTGSHQLYKLTVPTNLLQTTFTQLTHINEIPGHGMVVDELIVAGGKVFMKTPTYIAANDPTNTGPSPQNGGLFVYDPATDTTTRLTDDGDPASPQYFFLPAEINGVLYFGGFNPATNAFGTFHFDFANPGAPVLEFQPNSGLGSSSEEGLTYNGLTYWNGNSAINGSGSGQVYAFNPVDGSYPELTHLNAANGGIVVDKFFEMGGAVYFHAHERVPGSGFAAGIFKLDSNPGNPLGAARVTDESVPGTPQGFFFFFDTGPGLVYHETDTVTIDVLANDTDHDPSSTADNFTLVSVSVANVQGPNGVVLGTLDVNAAQIINNKLQFNPGTAFQNLYEGQTVTVTFNYTMSDGQGGTSSSTATVTFNGSSVAGYAVDGYISGATVFADTNDNGMLDFGETSTTTDAGGRYVFTTPVTGPLVLTGGTDISTNQTFHGVLRAPDGATTITPLTTLVAALVDAGATAAAANAQVLSALGLQPTLNLSDFDPIAAALSNNPADQAAGAAAYAAAVTVQNTLTQAAAVLEGAGASSAAAIAAVTASLAAELSGGAPVDLGTASVISLVLNNATAGAGADPLVVASVAGQTAAIISAANALITNSTETGLNLLVAATQVATVAQGDATTALLHAVQAVATDPLDTSLLTGAVSNFTGTSLTNAVDAAPVGDIGGATNIAPTAAGTNSVTTDEDTASTAVAIGATDLDGDTLTYSVKPGFAPTKGTVEFSGGNFTYTPNANVNGADTFTILVSDGNGGMAEQVVSVTINPVNDAPTAAPTGTLANGTEDETYVGTLASLLAGFTDADNDTLSIANITASDGSAVAINGNNFTVSAPANANGLVTLLYNVIDGNGGILPGQTRSFTRAPVNDAPTGAPTATLASGTEDQAYVITLSALLQGFSDIDSTLSVSSVSADHGSVASDGAGGYTVTPAANYNGLVTLTYGVTDGSTTLSGQTLSFTLAAANDAPNALNLSSLAIAENNAAGATVATLSAADPDGAGLFTYALVSGTGSTDNAAFSISGAQLRFNGSADFETKSSYAVRLQVTDADGLSFERTATINVTNVSPEIIKGTSGNDTLTGGSDIDYIFGLDGNDTLFGLGNNDILTGGKGRDVMTGGAGDDDFDFNSIVETGKTASTRDVIKDFVHLHDNIDLSTIDANGSAAGNTAFKFLATKGAAFTGVKGQLHWLQINVAGTANDKTIIEGDINGDKVADFQIELTGLKLLTAADFIL
jgi:Ca2+-binding RTX toxin-like protein